MGREISQRSLSRAPDLGCGHGPIAALVQYDWPREDGARHIGYYFRRRRQRDNLLHTVHGLLRVQTTPASEARDRVRMT